MVNDYNKALRLFYELERIHEQDDLLSTLRKKQLILNLICILLESQDNPPNFPPLKPAAAAGSPLPF